MPRDREVAGDLVEFGVQGIGQYGEIGEVAGVGDRGHGERAGVGEDIEADGDVAAFAQSGRNG